jgi:predicted nuclease of predicted toxin-antitoxin system
MDRYLANENFPAEIVRWLRTNGHDVVHAAESHVAEDDRELLALAQREARIVLTFDQDFGELVFHQREPAIAGVVLFRMRRQTPEVVIPFLQSFFLSNLPLAGFFTVASPGQFRQAPLQDS